MSVDLSLSEQIVFIDIVSDVIFQNSFVI